jgi:isopentenyl diphosphate isomerase/L-lactate dehydrogenase-like FMN-dependent dehydrogenase
VSDDAISLADVEARARAVLDDAAYGYFAGGAADELTLADNVAAFRRLRLVPRVLRGGRERSLRTTVLGMDLALPILVAPLAYQKVAHPEGELAIARAAAAAGTAMCLSSLSNHPIEEVVAAAPGAPRLFQLYPYRDRAMTDEVVARAAAAGFRALVITVDTTAHGRREREARLGFALPADCPLPCVPVPADHAGPLTPHDVTSWMAPDLTWDDIARFGEISDLPVVVKGVLAAEDAQLAVQHGVAGVIVSNHGGRQLDTAIATIDVLAEIVAAVDGAAEVLLDGGVRRGSDVVKALALGARAVMIGRPYLWGLAADGQAGVENVLDVLRSGIDSTLLGLGHGSVRELSPSDLLIPDGFARQLGA